MSSLSPEECCFVCGCPSPSKNDFSKECVGEALSSSSHIGNIVFVGKILFGIPHADIFWISSNNLTTTSSSTSPSTDQVGLPEIVFCAQCQVRVEQAREIYQDLWETLRRFRTVQKELVEIVKRNATEGPPVGKRRRHNDEVERFDKWRQFVANFDPQLFHLPTSDDYGSDTDPFVVENLSQLLETICESLKASESSPESNDALPVCKSEIEMSEPDEDDELVGPLELLQDDGESNDNRNDRLDEIKEEEDNCYSEGENSESSEEAEWEPDDSLETSDEEDKEDMTDPLENAAEESDRDDSDEEFVPETKRKRGRPRKTPPTTKSSSDKDFVPKKRGRPRKAVGRDAPVKKCDNRVRKEGVLHPCTVEGCPATFLTESALKVHLSRHSMKNTHHCQHCNAGFLSRKYLLSHVTKSHPDFVCTCHICGFTCFNDHGLTVHLKSNHQIIRPPKEYKCPEESCAQVFTKREIFKVHLSKHRGVPEYQCSNCDRAFFEPRQLKRHHDKMHVDQGTRLAFLCHLCEGGKSFTSGEYLSQHLHLVHDQGRLKGKRKKGARAPPKPKTPQTEEGLPHKCPQCGKCYTGKQSLYRHLRAFHEKRFSFYCEVCGEGFLAMVHLNAHLFRAHQLGSGKECRYRTSKKQEVKAQCPVVGCRAYYWGKQAEEKLRQHTIATHGEDGQGKRFQCHFCGQGFSLRYKFKAHLLIHENKDTRPFKCDTCGKGFANRAYLRYHQLRTHKAEKLIRRSAETKAASELPEKTKDQG